jgi:hypothetical protein
VAKAAMALAPHAHQAAVEKLRRTSIPLHDAPPDTATEEVRGAWWEQTARAVQVLQARYVAGAKESARKSMKKVNQVMEEMRATNLRGWYQARTGQRPEKVRLDSIDLDHLGIGLAGVCARPEVVQEAARLWHYMQADGARGALAAGV